MNRGKESMVDISMCGGENCELKDKCYRYLAKASKYRQAYIAPEKRGKDCKHFWEVKSKSQTRRLDIQNDF